MDSVLNGAEGSAQALNGWVVCLRDVLVVKKIN